MYKPAKHVDHRPLNLQKQKREIFHALNALLTSCGYWDKVCGFVNMFLCTSLSNLGVSHT